MLWNQKLEKDTPAYRLASSDATYIYALAGPGTGKSFAIKRRIARLLEEKDCLPSDILLITFTHTSVRDWQDGIDDIGLKDKRVPGMNRIVPQTLHDFCLSLARRCGIFSGTGRSTRILSKFEEKLMLSDLDARYGTVYQKGKMFRVWAADNVNGPLDIPGTIGDEEMFSFGRDVMQWLHEHKAMVWGELPREVLRYLKQNPLSPEFLRYKHILVDEYQDLTRCEQTIIDLLARECSLVVVGDDDQSIYEFRHAYPEGMRSFPQTHPDCRQIHFPQCRRSPRMVVELANTLIKHNHNRSLGELEPSSHMLPGNVKIVQAETDVVEICAVAAKIIRDLDQKRFLPKEVLVLTPDPDAAKRLLSVLRQQEKYHAISYFQEAALSSDQAKYNLSLLSLLANPKDLVSLRYLIGSNPILKTHPHSFKAKNYQALRVIARNKHYSILRILELLSSGQFVLPRGENTSMIYKLMEAYGMIQLQLKELNEIAKKDKHDLMEVLGGDQPEDEDFRSILENALFEPSIDFEKNATKSWVKIYRFVKNAIYSPQYQKHNDSIRIMSLHGAKGLSARYTVIFNATDAVLPWIHSGSSVPAELQMECERRLFYVAITRCKGGEDSPEGNYPGTLIISSHINNTNNTRGKPPQTRASRFISEFLQAAPPAIGLSEADIFKDW